MKLKICPFNELSLNELYQILKIRSEIFVVEQDCVYNDPDGLDRKAFHLVAIDGDKIIGTARIFNPGVHGEHASFGRLAIEESYREQGLAHEFMNEIHSFIHRTMGSTPILIEAQLYLRAFYSRHGYEAFEAPYLLDGIEHIKMLRPQI